MPGTPAVRGRGRLWYNPDGGVAAIVDERKHGKVLCWAARISGTGLSTLAGGYFVYSEIDPGSSPLAVPVAIWFFSLTVAPSLLAWKWHRAGGAFMLVVCLLYADAASVIIDGEDFLRVVLPYALVWALSGVLHLVVSRMERRAR